MGQDQWRKRNGAQTSIDLDSAYCKTRTLANQYLQGRQAMKNGNFTGIRGNSQPGHRDVGNDGRHG